MKMKKLLVMTKGFLAAGVIGTLLIGGTPTAGQDLVPVSDITGGASIFVFRTSSKAAPKKFVSRTKTKPTKTQRIETAKKVSKQYVALAKIKPRRIRTASVDPNDKRLPSIPTMPRDEASKLFAGVGEYYMDRDDFNNAIDLFRESFTMDAKNVRAQNGLSEALALKGNELLVKNSPAAARKFFEESLSYNPKNSPAYFGLAEVFSELDKETEATTNYERALANDKDLTEIYVPLGILYYQQGEIAKADDLLTKALAVSPGDAQTQHFLGLIRYSQNRNQEALAAFEKAKSLDPTNAEAFFQSAETLVRLDRNDEAVADYLKATTLKSNYFEAWLGLGAAYYKLEKFAEAVTAYKQAARLKNDNIEVYENLGDANRQLGNFNDAEANYNLAITFMQRDKTFGKDAAADIYNKIGYVVAKQCELNIRKALPCKWNVAIDSLEKAAELGRSTIDNANLGWAYYNAARIDMAARREADARIKLERAKINLQKATELNPNFVDAPNLNLGVVLIDLGEYPAAVETLKKVVDKRPEWNFSRYALGTAYFKTNDFDNAAKSFRKAVDKDPNYLQAWASLGYSELKRKNGKEVQKVIERLRKMNVNEANKLEIQMRAANLSG